ncbi:hypothetical protein GCM10009526_04620 [Glutamicibacter creatinolyticus]
MSPTGPGTHTPESDDLRRSGLHPWVEAVAPGESLFGTTNRAGQKFRRTSGLTGTAHLHQGKAVDRSGAAYATGRRLPPVVEAGGPWPCSGWVSPR